MAQLAQKTGDWDRMLKAIARLEQELTFLRVEVERARSEVPLRKFKPMRDYAFCGMWKGREDMRGLTAEEWLNQMRAQQWNRM